MTGSADNNNNNNNNADNAALNNEQVIVNINDNNNNNAQPHPPKQPVIWRNPDAKAGVVEARNNVTSARGRACQLYGKALFWQSRGVCAAFKGYKGDWLGSFRYCFLAYFPCAFMFDIVGLIIGWLWFVLICPCVVFYGICYKKCDYNAYISLQASQIECTAALTVCCCSKSLD